MARAYNVVDADGHILEPLDLWDNYIDPEFRERRPRFVIDENGKERLSVEGKLLGNPRGIGYHGKKMVSDPMYEPFWAMAEAPDFSIGFHEGLTNAMPTVGVDRFENDRAARHMISHTMEMMLAALSVIWGGVVDRHPRLRVAFLESGGGWIAPWLDRMDRHFDDQDFNESAPKFYPYSDVSFPEAT